MTRTLPAAGPASYQALATGAGPNEVFAKVFTMPVKLYNHSAASLQ